MESAFWVSVNGVEIGFSKDSRLPAEFDITEALSKRKDGARQLGDQHHELLVLVARWSDGSYLEVKKTAFALTSIFIFLDCSSVPRFSITPGPRSLEDGWDT